MAFVTSGEARLHYEVDGPEDGPVLVLSHSLGCNLDMWAPQLATFAETHRVVRYDSRGHGQSSTPKGPYTIEQLGRDVVALLDGLGLDRVAFCGLSKGGMVGQWLGVNAGDRLTRLVLCNTSSFTGMPEIWDQRIATVREKGIHALVAGVIDRWFTKSFQEREPAAVASIVAMLEATDPEGYMACCAAVRDMDQRETISAITVPTLVIAGQHDLATPPEHGQLIAERIAGAKLVTLDAAHLSNIEAADRFTDDVAAFLEAA